MLIKELEKCSGLTRDTLRYYERRKLISAPLRTDNGYRHYDEHTLVELKFIGVAQAVGFSLDQIRVAIPKLRMPPAQCPELLAGLLEQKKAVVEEINKLKQRVLKLDRLISRFEA